MATTEVDTQRKWGKFSACTVSSNLESQSIIPQGIDRTPSRLL
jgi:hypothetical protein